MNVNKRLIRLFISMVLLALAFPGGLELINLVFNDGRYLMSTKSLIISIIFSIIWLTTLIVTLASEKFDEWLGD